MRKTTNVLLAACFVVFYSTAGFAQRPSSVLKIRISGAEGKLIPQAYIEIKGEGVNQEVSQPGNNFSFALAKTGIYKLTMGGVYHRAVKFPLFIEKPGTYSVEVQLAPFQYLEKIDSVFVTGDFNDFSLEKGLFPLTRESDGRFRAAVPVTADTLRYEVLGSLPSAKASTEGTDGVRYISKNLNYGGVNAAVDFTTVVKTRNGKAEIVFDPSLLPRSSVEQPVLLFKNPNSRTAKIAEAFLDVNNRFYLVGKAWRQHVKNGGSPGTMKYDKSREGVELIQRYQKEQDPLVREVRLLLYLNYMENAIDSSFARKMFQSISPASPVWAIDPSYWESAFHWAGASLGEPVEASEYLTKMITQHKSPDVIHLFLFYALQKAKGKGDNSLVEKYYNRFIKEFPNSPYMKWISRYAPDGVLKKGKPVPHFILSALEDKNTTYSPSSLKGKVYLIDFWATWCGPCVAVLPEITKVYEEFKDKGFTVLSLSVDKKPEEVEAFRKKWHSMPWMHTLLEEGFDHPVAKAFQVTSLPRTTLVDQNGNIVANDTELEGDGLRRILISLFEEKKD